MGIIRVEPETPVKHEVCGACGGTNQLLHGYVYDDEQPHAVYFVEWCECARPRRVAYLTLGIGRFEDDDATGREAFCLQWTSEGLTLTNEPIRDRPRLLGAFVPRERALASPTIDELWHIADHIALDDPNVRDVSRWLGGG